MNYNHYRHERHDTTGRHGKRRLAATLLALALPMLVAALLSGNLFRAGTLRPGDVLDARAAHAASHHGAHSAPARETETETRTTTPGTTGTAEMTGTPGSTTTAQPTGTPGGNIVDVRMQRHDVFAPAYVTIQTGTTVRWTNTDDEQHTTTSDSGVWNSGPLNSGQQFLYTFLTPGTYTYACLIHPEMQGTIVVTGQEITPTPGTPTETPTPGSGRVDVSITNYAFQPQNVTVNVGTTVRWTNLDSAPHTVASDSGLFDSGTLNQGGTFDYVFNTPGVYTYHCNIHNGMRGTITVGNMGGSATVSPTWQSTQTAQVSNTPATTATSESTGTMQPTGTMQSTGTAAPSTTAQPTQTPGRASVNISNYAYSPSSITVQVGTTVRWTNLDNDHHSITSMANPRVFDSGELAPNATWEYTFTTPGSYTYFCTVHGTFMQGTVNVVAAPTATPTLVPGQLFGDVTPADYFYTPVNWLANRGVISGYSDGTFRPYNNTTRGQLSKIVVLGEGWAINTAGAPHFNDVTSSNPFYSYIETAFNHGVISGYADGTFRWGNNVTRAQLSKIVVSARGWAMDTTGGPHFADVQSDHAFYSYIETAFNRGIVSGYSDGTFKPGNNATRGQISKIVYNALNGQR